MLRKNVTRLLMSSHPPCQYIYNENLNVLQPNVNRQISGGGEGGESFILFSRETADPSGLETTDIRIQ